MSYLTTNNFLKNFAQLVPMIILFISVFNEFDANYLGIPFLSFNFAFIIIFYWTLKKIEYFGYGLIFLAGIINDVVVGNPLGLSSFCFMLICVATSYFRSITLRPNITKDWFFFFRFVGDGYCSVKYSIDRINLVMDQIFISVPCRCPSRQKPSNDPQTF